MKKILYSLLFIYSSLFAITTGDCIQVGDTVDYRTLGSKQQDITETTTTDLTSYIGKLKINGLGYIYVFSSDKKSYGNYWNNHYYTYGSLSSCSPAGACDEGQVDINGTCQDISLPSNFPTSENKGIPSIREDDTVEADCIPGKEFHSGIAYAKIIGWNSAKNKCEIGAFFCNSGLTWDNISMSCKIPDSEAQLNPSDDDISQALADSCKSGKWAKKWTYDYCNQPLCYIPLDAQNYNLSCGNKYLEYDCTSDYRIKKFVQVSCGDVAKEDYNNTSLSIGGDTSTPNIVPDTTQNQATTDSVVSAINSQSSKLTSSLDGLKDGLDTISQKSDLTNNKLDSISNQLSNLNDKLSPLKKVDDLSNDSSIIADLMNNSINDGFNTYLNRDYTGGLATSQCGSIGTYSINFHGSTITILSQNTINELPMSIFKTMIIFAFVFSGVIIAFRGV